MKKHRWIAPVCWFVLPTLIIGFIYIGLVLEYTYEGGNSPVFVDGIKTLLRMLQDPEGHTAIWRFLSNTLILALPMPLLLSLVGGLGFLLMRRTALPSPARYAIVFIGTLLVGAVASYVDFRQELEVFQLLLSAGLQNWWDIQPDISRYALLSLQGGVFACLFHYVCVAISRKRAEKLSFTTPE